MIQSLKYTVDIVLCIDATGSMAPVIDAVKRNALAFYHDLTENMSSKGKMIDNFRTKVIVFRDFFADGNDAFRESPFFALPTYNTEFANYINGIHAHGGGDDPENGLEAVAVAIKTPWNIDGDKSRQVIVVWTDTSAHKLDKGARSMLPNYPPNIAGNFDELYEDWNNENYINQNGRRLLMYAPDVYPWNDMQKHFDHSLHFPSKAGLGLLDMDYATIIDTIAGSI